MREKSKVSMWPEIVYNDATGEWIAGVEATWDEDGNDCSDYMVTVLCETPGEALSLAVAWLEENVGVRLPEAPDGLHVCSEGQAVVDGKVVEVVPYTDPRLWPVPEEAPDAR